MGGAARDGPRATYALLGPGGPLVFFLSLGCFLCKNIHAIQIFGQFEFRKVLKRQKYTKQVFPVLQGYNQNNGD
jgi:hypothetical protein